MFDPPDLAVILNAIRAGPDEAEHRFALADWLFLHARDDEAVAVRTLWPTLRENLAVVSLEDTLADVAKHAAVLATIARDKERQENETPPV